MKNTIKIIIPALIVLLMLRCEKDDPKENEHDILVYDTVAIGNYFPVFPGSYWVYLTTNGDTVVHKTDSVYALWSNYNPLNNHFDTTKFYVPKYDGHAVKKYSIYVGSDSYHESGWETILPDSFYVGNLFQKRYDWPNTYYSGRIQTMDTTLMVNSFSYDSVMIVFEYCGPSIGLLPSGKTYYAKNIGIIKMEHCSFQSFDSIFYEESLISYYVAK